MNKKTEKKAEKELTLSQQAAIKQANLDNANAAAMADTPAGDIWKEIKDKKIEMFALPEQLVCMHCHPVCVEPNKLYLLINSSAVLPSLETAIGNKYVIELNHKFVVVSRAPVPLV
jgi:hypothetical protein